jgi:zinc transporter ZupT
MKTSNKIIVFFLLNIFLVFAHNINTDKHINNHHHHNHNHKTNKIENILYEYIKNYSKLNQGFFGAFIISSAPVPIFILLYIFNIKNIKILNIMSSFSAGALIGDVFIHNLPEIITNSNKNSNMILICIGILFLFLSEKIMNYFNNNQNNNIILSLFSDFLHNLTDGMAIGASFNKNLRLALTISLSIFFHEIPHEIGDFSYLLKQKMSLNKAIFYQLVTALGSFIGVYLSFLFGEKFSYEIISFASGTFLYLAINVILNDLKETEKLIFIVLEGISFCFGAIVLELFL